MPQLGEGALQGLASLRGQLIGANVGGLQGSSDMDRGDRIIEERHRAQIPEKEEKVEPTLENKNSRNPLELQAPFGCGGTQPILSTFCSQGLDRAVKD